MLMGGEEGALPVDAELKIRLSTASGPPDTNAPSFYFDGVDIMVRNAELCTQLEARLNNPARHQAARLDLTSAPGLSCTLMIVIPTGSTRRSYARVFYRRAASGTRLGERPTGTDPPELDQAWNRVVAGTIMVVRTPRLPFASVHIA